MFGSVLVYRAGVAHAQGIRTPQAHGSRGFQLGLGWRGLSGWTRGYIDARI